MEDYKKIPKAYRNLFSNPYHGRFYKYRPAIESVDEDEKTIVFNQYTEKIIRTQALYHPEPRSFNDPFEFAPYMAPMSKQAVKRMLNKKKIDKQTKYHKLESFDEMKGPLQSHLRKSYVNILDNSHFGVCCFSQKADIIQMWSYYSDNHTGVCLGFDTNHDTGLERNKMFLKEVRYETERPSFKVGTNTHNWDVLFTKEENWKHEQEVRRIEFGLISKVSRNRRFNKQALRELVFGCKAEQETIDHYSKLLQDHGFGHVKLKIAVKNDRYYKLHIEDL